MDRQFRRTPREQRGSRSAVLLLPGQGAQEAGMAAALYDRDVTFTTVVNALFHQLGTDGRKLWGSWLDGDPALDWDDASLARPLLFAIELGVGHSIGELAAGALAGVFGIEDAAVLLRARALAMADSPSGGMLVVGCRAAELAGFLAADPQWAELPVGAVNAPRRTVLAGPDPALRAAKRRLRAEGRSCVWVKARQPFHSTSLAPAARRWERAFAGVVSRAQEIPLRSTRTGRWLRDDEAADPAFWAGQLTGCVLFWPALDGLLADLAPARHPVLVETGPGRSLSALVLRHPVVRRGEAEVLPLLPSPSGEKAWRTWLDGL